MDDHTRRGTDLRILIADDEAPARREIRRLLQNEQDMLIIHESDNGIDAYEQALMQRPDIVFLDMQMPGMTGIEVAQGFLTHEYVPLIVFITAYDSYAVEAFDLHAVDYLLKPMHEQRFHRMLTRIRERLAAQAGQQLDTSRLQELLQQLHTDSGSPSAKRISVFKGEKIIPLKIQDILFAEAKGRSCMIYTADAEYRSSYLMYELQQILTMPMFYHSHRSYLINLDRIASIEIWFNNTYRVMMEGRDEHIPVSRGNTAEFRELMNLV
ncbi:MAG: LytTR family DNA-binding domain-containing protein [Spirochaetia bacterium]|nr:LytTR family DNA-binding domain-containing protein [Spirochaetia bacterium]MCF7940003.1 LytTR family DNA-binding domain-containing protein [Spirochaetia bacterium]